MELVKEVQFRLSKVKEHSFFCTDFASDIANEKIEKNLKIEIGVNFELFKKSNEFAINTLIQYKFKTEEILRYENQIIFEVKNINEVVKGEKDRLNIKDEFLLSLLNVVIGTTRGMLIKNTMGKRINDFPLPIMNPTDLLNNLKNKRIKE